MDEAHKSIDLGRVLDGMRLRFTRARQVLRRFQAGTWTAK
jgi:hypothetical protein